MGQGTARNAQRAVGRVDVVEFCRAVSQATSPRQHLSPRLHLPPRGELHGQFHGSFLEGSKTFLMELSPVKPSMKLPWVWGEMCGEGDHSGNLSPIFWCHEHGGFHEEPPVLD